MKRFDYFPDIDVYIIIDFETYRDHESCESYQTAKELCKIYNLIYVLL